MHEDMAFFFMDFPRPIVFRFRGLGVFSGGGVGKGACIGGVFASYVLDFN